MHRVPESKDYTQKEPPEVFYEKKCSYKFHKYHRKTPVPEFLSDNVAGLRLATSLKRESGTGVFL